MPTQLPKLKETKIDNKRLYVTPEGNKYPSITTVTGLRELEGIKLWRTRVGEAEANKISNESTTRGTILHNMAEKHLQNEIQLLIQEAPQHISVSLIRMVTLHQ